MGMSDSHEHSHGADARDGAPVIEVDIGNAYDASEYAGLEERLRGLTGVTSVHLDRTLPTGGSTYHTLTPTAPSTRRHH